MTDAGAELEALLDADEDRAFAAAARLFERMRAARAEGAEVDVDTLTALGLRRGATATDALDARLLGWAAGQPTDTVDLVAAFVAGVWRRRAGPIDAAAVGAAVTLSARADLDADGAYGVGGLLVDAARRLEGAARPPLQDAVRRLAPLTDAQRQALLRRL